MSAENRGYQGRDLTIYVCSVGLVMAVAMGVADAAAHFRSRLAEFNPRYIAWVMTQGPGQNHEFMLWIQQKWAEFRRETGGSLRDEQRLFDEWLAKNA